MDSALVCLILLTMGMNFGWQPATGDFAGYEYVVQVEPELLDKLKQGDSIPIESNVPPEVSPIRRVRIVVGHGDLPRVPLAADTKKLEKYVAKDVRSAAPTAVVRGQAPDETAGSKAVPRTANFAGDNVWGTGSGSATIDRYNQPTGTLPPPPSASLLDRSQNALSETGTSLKQGIDAGFQSANGQVQDWSNSAGRQLQQAGNSVGITSSGVSAPPWPTSATAPAATATNGNRAIVQTATGWTSIGGNLPAPPLKTPLPVASTSNAPTRSAALSSTGPTFPASTSGTATGNESIRSVLVDPNHPASGSEPPWPANSASNAGSQPGISRSGGTFAGSNNGLEQIRSIPGAQSTPQQPATARYNDPFVQDDRFGAQPQTLPAAQTAATPPLPQNNNWMNRPGTANAGANFPAAPPASVITQRPPDSNQPAGQTSPVEQQPWLPLLVAILSLIGSLSANLFLGWSYLDARQRYSSLVYRTASAFRRTTSEAA